MKAYVIVSAILRFNDKVLLVRHKGDFGSKPYWTLPGGTANEAEDVYTAIRREVLEETGIIAKKISSLAYCTQHINHKRDWQSSVYVFEVLIDEAHTIQLQDPDGDIQNAAFFHIDEAVSLLNEGPFEVIKVPAIHYLSTPVRSSTPVWVFNEFKDNTIKQLFDEVG
jgi:ADP-ribose pyrophosphatase YjhB (NUDIX family)